MINGVLATLELQYDDVKINKENAVKDGRPFIVMSKILSL
jgi:hypothetical protein